MATSFPFLKIARDHRLSYGAVIRCAQAIEDVNPNAISEITDLDVRWKILETLNEEDHRRQGKLKYD